LIMLNKSSSKELDGESIILPVLVLENDDNDVDNDAGKTRCHGWTIVKPPVLMDKSVSTTSSLELHINSNDPLQTHFDSLINATDSKDDASIETHNYEIIEDRNQICRASSSTQKALKEKLAHTNKTNLLFFCLLFLLITTVHLAWKLNASKALNLQLQIDLNRTTSLLKSYRTQQEWTMLKENNEETSSFEVENCWLEASVTLGPCASDPIKNVKDTYKKTYEDAVFYFDKAWNWWGDSPNHPNNSDTTDSCRHSEENVSWYEQASKFLILNMKEASMLKNNTIYQSRLWSEMESWLGVR